MASSDSDNDEELNAKLRTVAITPRELVEATPRSRHNILYGPTNTEEQHDSALQEARREHRRIRENAVKAFQAHELREQERKHKEEIEKEEQRLRAERDNAEAARRAEELRAKSIPKPTPSPQPPPKAASPPPPEVSAPKPEPIEVSKPAPVQHAPIAPAPVQAPVQVPAQVAPKPVQPPIPAPVSQPPPRAPEPVQAPQPVTPPAVQAPPKPQHTLLPGADEYLDIHKRLKNLRRFLADHGKQDNEFKKKMGEMRREIRKSVGQLTEGKGANKIPVCFPL